MQNVCRIEPSGSTTVRLRVGWSRYRAVLMLPTYRARDMPISIPRESAHSRIAAIRPGAFCAMTMQWIVQWNSLSKNCAFHLFPITA